MHKIKTAVLISGRGSNMLAILKAAQDNEYPAVVEVVISNRPLAKGLEKAEDLGIKTLILDHKAYKSKSEFEKDLDEILKNLRIQLICCAGFMRILSPWFVNRWKGKLLNIHPSLLPKYKGLNTHKRAINSGDIIHGCSVHFINSELDSGKVILQKRIKILEDDTPQTLSERLLVKELEAYPQALKMVADELISSKKTI
ncbi:MAG: phosphoribosylglycinamide formyltransferase [Hellea sp.]